MVSTQSLKWLEMIKIVKAHDEIFIIGNNQTQQT